MLAQPERTASHSSACAASEPRARRADDSERILVVDDEPNITDLVATALRYEGFDVEVASHRQRGDPGGRRPSGPT